MVDAATRAGAVAGVGLALDPGPRREKKRSHSAEFIQIEIIKKILKTLITMDYGVIEEF